MKLSFVISVFIILNYFTLIGQEKTLKINDQNYYEIPSLNVMVFDDFYPDGHQGGVSIVQFGNRLASNGDVRLEPSPGQWSPVPKVGKRIVDKDNGIITVDLMYPDSSKDKKGFNPINYPDLNFTYIIRTEAIGNKIKLTVDLEKPIPDEWVGIIGFNIELFPGEYFGEHYLMDDNSGIFPQQANGPMVIDDEGKLQIQPLAMGKKLIVAPGILEKQIKFEGISGNLELIDQRGLHNNGWFTIRSTIKKNVSKNAIQWIITPSYEIDWRYEPVIQISQIGYHPNQVKFAVIELDKLTEQFDKIELFKINEESESIIKEENNPELWGNFLRYKYLRFDFSEIKEEGLYKLKYGDVISNIFEIKNNLFARHVWQPTLEYFLPVQMCHMKVSEKYRVWHGLCHLDDARMAPLNLTHFDGYFQGNSSLTDYKSGDHVPNINVGGWHDAGDYDLRVESQGGTVYTLSLAYEMFPNNIDQTSIDQDTRKVEIHQPDGKLDILQQVEHGVLSIINGYESLGRLYRGIICPTLSQYVLLGDGSTMTDNFIYKTNEKDPLLNHLLPEDDRWVFTERNGRRELQIAQNLAAASRVLREYNPKLSTKCLTVSESLFSTNDTMDVSFKINAAAELFLTTFNSKYSNILYENSAVIVEKLPMYGMVIGRFVKSSDDEVFNNKIKIAVGEGFNKIIEQQNDNPYGVPYKPYIWGAGWGIQSFGVNLLFLHLGFPEIVNSEYVFNALNFVLGCHPGENTASFVSGVGVNSLTVAYGVNRADWSFIPGGVGSGTALIRPDLPELKTWPYFWQQTEYVIGGGGTNFMLLAMAADYLLNDK